MNEKNKRNHTANGRHLEKRTEARSTVAGPRYGVPSEGVNGSDKATYVPLPKAPRTASPVPLLSIHAVDGRGEYGDPAYPGNCSGLLIKDLLRFFRAKRVLDPMAGGGTCGDVCHELKIECESMDLRSGFDATNPASYAGLGTFDFIWLHPPYGSIVKWSDDPRCLANAPTVKEFYRRLHAVMENCRNVLSEGGHLAILVGDQRYQGNYLALPFRSYVLAEDLGFELAAPEIIRFSHGTTSKDLEYRFSFIPRLHEQCLVFRKSLV